MVVYPEIESWDEFYPSEIFIRKDTNDSMEDVLSVINKANIGTTINLGMSATATQIYKKIGNIVSLDDMDSNLILLLNIKIANPGT